jgi:hypothetical protein
MSAPQQVINQAVNDYALNVKQFPTHVPLIAGGNKSDKIKYKGRMYAVRKGPRGGKYIKVGDKKIYV